MYKKVEAALVLRGMTKKDAAQKVGMNYGTFCAKMRKEYTFSLDEALRVWELCNTGEPIESLFDESA